MSLKFRLIILFILIAFIPIVIFGLVSIGRTNDVVTEKILDQMQSLAESKKNELILFIEGQNNLLKSITSRTKFRDTLGLYLEDPSPEYKDTILNILLDSKEPFPSLNKVSVFTPTGELIVSTKEDLSVEVGGVDRFFNKAKEGGENVFFEESTSKIVVFGPIERDGVQLGLATIEIESDVINNIVNNYKGLGETGEVLIAKRDSSGNALFLHKRRFENDPSAKVIVSKEDLEVPMTQALLRNEAVFLSTTDYRGHNVVSATAYIEEADWGLVVKFDREEIAGLLDNFSKTIIIVLIVVMIFIGLIAYAISLSITRPINILADRTKSLSKGKFDKKIPEDVFVRKDEISSLAKDFQKMARNLKSFYEGLENKVKERTFELEESKIRSEAILGSVGDGLVFTDTDAKIILLNKAAENILGRSQADVLGKDWFGLIKVQDKKKKIVPREKLPLSRVLKGEDPVSTSISDSYHYMHKEGNYIPVVITASNVKVENEIIGAVIAFKDITQEMEINRAKSEFVSLASHQLRTPITGLKWTVERFIKKEKLSKKGKEYLSDIHHSMVRLSELVDSLLNVSRIETGSVSVKPEKFDAIDFMDGYLSETRPIQEKKNIKLTFNKKVKTLNIESDKNLVSNIIQSLVSNALEYTPEEGKIDVSIEDTGESFLISVKDNGIGIPKEDQGKLFEKFHRAENARKYKADGSGLGLYIVKKAVNLLGGRIMLRSAVGQGTTFYVELPKVAEARGGEKTLL